jgi:hypothetical protein
VRVIAQVVGRLIQPVLDGSFAVSARRERFTLDACHLMVVGHGVRKIVDHIVDAGAVNDVPRFEILKVVTEQAW